MIEWFRKGLGRRPANTIGFPDHREYGIDDKDALPLPEPKIQEPKTHFTVGTNDNGEVVLRVGEKYATTLTMNPVACRHLIRMLEAAIIGE